MDSFITKEILKNIIDIVIGFLMVAVAIVLSKALFKNLQKDRKKIHLTFFERVVQVVLVLGGILYAVSVIDKKDNIWRMIFGSTVILGGVIGFAAQGVIKDVLAGLMLSMRRPFDIGDRILLDSVEKPSVVEDLTVSHTILRTMDNIRYIVPNSEINEAIITNTSFKQKLRGSFIKVKISYGSDVRQAVLAVREAIRDNPYTRPNNPANEDLGGYGDVYIMDFQDSALLLETVIWTEPYTDNFLACSEVRASIMEKFREYGISIPYNYLNVIVEDQEDYAGRKKKRLEKHIDKYGKSGFNINARNTKIRTDSVLLKGDESDYNGILQSADYFCRFHKLSSKEQHIIELLSEELVNFTKEISEVPKGKYYLEGNRSKVRIHLSTNTAVSSKTHNELINLSSTGHNEAASSFIGKINDMVNSVVNGSTDHFTTISYNDFKNTSGADYSLEKKLITSLSDEIKVSISREITEIVVYKKLDA